MQNALVLGVVTGITYGLLAVGIVLIYKTNRFINIAHAQLGAVSALLLATFVLDHGWSWWLAFPVVLAVGALTGVLIERLVIRPLVARKRKGTSLLLVSIGVAQLLLGLTYVQALAPDETTLYAEGYPTPFDTSWTLGDVVLRSHHVLTLVLVPLVIAALVAFLRYSVWGKAIRAAASNGEAARLCGIPVGRVSALAWAIAGVLSAITAVLQAPGQGSFSGAALGPELLLRALGAAAMGGFTSVPAALGGGLLLGEVEHLTLHFQKNAGAAQLMVFLTVLAIIVIRGKVISAAADDTTGGGEDPEPLRIPAGVERRFLVRRQRAVLGAVGLFLGIVVPLLPYFDTEGRRFQLVVALAMAIAGVSLTMLLGWAGQVSLGHFAVLGLGAFTAAKLGEHDLPLVPTLVVAGAVGALAMVVVGLPALRIRGLTLALTTLGFAVIAPTWLFRQSWIGSGGQSTVLVNPPGVEGIGRLDSQLSVYYVTLGLLALVLAAASRFRRSNAGRLVIAVRDNERSVASLGMTPATVKLSLLAASGFFVAAAGVLWGAAWQALSTDLVRPDHSLVLLAIPVIGGLGSLPGAVLGALALYLPSFFLGGLMESIFGSFAKQVGFQLAVGGLGLVLIPIFNPRGIAGAARDSWQRFLDTLTPVRTLEEEADDAPPLVVRDVAKRFGGLVVLDEVSIDVRPGEIVGLIGPNGAGKTTLMNAISGNLRADGGSVHLFGHDVTRLAPEFRSHYGLGRNYQDAKLFPGLTARETMQLAASRTARVGVFWSMLNAPWVRLGERRSRQRADEILGRLGLAPWAETLTSDLSTGTRRICELAVQLTAAPKVLLLDEPTAGVAQRDAEAFGPLLHRIRDELDCSILIVEHDMPLLMSVCDRVYAMELGRVIAEGTPEEIRNHPQVIASYLGTGDVAINRSGDVVGVR